MAYRSESARWKRDYFEQQINLATMEITLIGSRIFDVSMTAQSSRSHVTNPEFLCIVDENYASNRESSAWWIWRFHSFPLFLHSRTRSERETTFSRFVEQSVEGTSLRWSKRMFDNAFLPFFSGFIRLLTKMEKQHVCRETINFKSQL